MRPVSRPVSVLVTPLRDLALLAVIDGLREIVVHHRRVIRVRSVLVHDLPVARGLINAEARDDLQLLRRRRDEDVDQRRRRAEMIAKLRHVGGEAAEYEPPIAVEPRDRRQIELRHVEVRFGPAGLGRRHRGALAAGVEAEAVVGADEAFGVAGACGNKRRAAVAAGVQVAAERAIRLAHHEHRLAADVRREKVAGIADMRLMAEEDPVGLEDVAVFGLQDVRDRCRSCDRPETRHPWADHRYSRQSRAGSGSRHSLPCCSIHLHARGLADLNPFLVLRGDVGGELRRRIALCLAAEGGDRFSAFPPSPGRRSSRR